MDVAKKRQQTEIVMTNFFLFLKSLLEVHIDEVCLQAEWVLHTPRNWRLAIKAEGWEIWNWVKPQIWNWDRGGVLLTGFFCWCRLWPPRRQQITDIHVQKIVIIVGTRVRGVRSRRKRKVWVGKVAKVVSIIGWRSLLLLAVIFLFEYLFICVADHFEFFEIWASRGVSLHSGLLFGLVLCQ